MPARTTRNLMPLVRQICELIPPHMVSKIAREHEIDARKFSPWSHVVSHIYGQLTHAVGLNDICDALDLHQTELRAIRGATAPKRNTFSHANRSRNSQMARSLYWKMMNHLQTRSPSFAHGRIGKGYLRRFKKSIYAVDSTTIHLVANCMDWASHRRRKAAAKCHMNLNLQTMLPHYAVVDTARFTDNQNAWEVCAPLRKGEIVVFDKAYVDFAHLRDLGARGVWWVSRAKANLKHRTLRERPPSHPNVIRDRIVELTDYNTKKKYGEELRLVDAIVEVDGRNVQMQFLSNHLEWAAWTICELYRARWEIERFFKEVKQTVQLVDFVGHNRNAVQWQIWMALLVHLLMRYLAHLSQWTHSFTRLFTLVRAGLWFRYDLTSFLSSYGTAEGCFRMIVCPQQTYLPGLGPPP
jgi:hypothetical protein